MSGAKKWIKEHDKELLGGAALAAIAAPWALPALGMGGAAAGGAVGATEGAMGAGSASLFGPTAQQAGLLGLTEKAAAVPFITEAPLEAAQVGMPAFANSMGTEGAGLLSQARGGLVNAVGGLDNWDALTGIADKVGKAGKGLQLAQFAMQPPQAPMPQPMQRRPAPQPMAMDSFWQSPEELERKRLAALYGGYYG